MSDTGRKPLTDQAQEKLTPDSQKSTFDKTKEGVTNTADDVAGMAQPGDSKSTSQKLSDETSAKTGSAQETLSGASKSVQDTASNIAKSAQDTASSLGQKADSNTGAAQQSGKTYLEQAQDLAANTLNSASKAASDLASSISGEKK